MKKRMILLCLLPFLWMGWGCSSSHQVRERPYDQDDRYDEPSDRQARRPLHSSRDRYQRRRFRNPYRYDRSRHPHRAASQHAISKFRKYMQRTHKTVRVCRHKKRTIRRRIRSIQRSMQYQDNPYDFDRSRSKMYFYHRQLQRYHRCIKVYKHRMQWAKAYFYRRHGMVPKWKQSAPKRFAQKPHTYKQRPRLFAQRNYRPPVARRARPVLPIVPKPTAPKPVKPIAPKPAAPKPLAPMYPKSNNVPSMDAPKPSPVQPKVNPTPMQPALGVGSGMSASVQRWKQYCTQEKQKYPLQKNVRFLNRKTSLKGRYYWDSKSFVHKAVTPIQTLHSTRGRFVVLGADGRYSQAHCEDRTFHVWDTLSNRSIRLRPPITAYLTKNTHLVPWFQGKKHASVSETLLHYDPKQKRAGILLKSAFPALKGRSRFMYLVWNLETRQITHAWTLGSPGCHGAYRTVGVTPDGSTLYYVQDDHRVLDACNVKRPSSTAHTHRLLALNIANGLRRTVGSIAPSHRRLQVIVPNRDFSQISAVEYTELKTNQGKAYVIQTRTGQVRSFAAPSTPYGVTYTQDQKHLLMYSSKQGVIVRLALQTGRQTTHKTFRLGHALGLSPTGRYVFVVFHSGVEIRDAATMKRVTFMKHRVMMGNVKFIHVDGSSVAGGMLFVKNGEKLFIQKLNVLSAQAARPQRKPSAVPPSVLSARKNKKKDKELPVRDEPSTSVNSSRQPSTGVPLDTQLSPPNQRI